MNLTDQQKTLLRQLVANHELTRGAEFIFTWSTSGGGLSYPLGLHFLPEGDETDLHRLSRENLVDVIGRALSVLANAGLARFAREKTAGRPVERWFAVWKEVSPEGVGA